MIDKYLESKEFAWAETTKKNVRGYLKTLSHLLTPESEPKELWEHLQKFSPYSRVTLWAYAADYYQWLTGSSKFHQWRKENSRAFKNTYERKAPEISYEQAQEKISKIRDAEVRAKAFQLLKGGLRFSESCNVQSGHCVGKGSKPRKVFVKEIPFTKSYSWFYKTLKAETGLTPHDLRKVRANDLCKKGARPEELCAIMGWENFSTAQSYIKANDERLKKLMED